MRVIYVAGPFRGKTPWDVERNVRRAEEIAYWVSCQGAVALCPHSMYRFFDKTLTDEFWLAATLELATRSDVLFLVPGWTGSEGSLGERRYFETAKKPIYETAEGLVAYLKAPPRKPSVPPHPAAADRAGPIIPAPPVVAIPVKGGA
jgi:hypothetical protein